MKFDQQDKQLQQYLQKLLEFQRSAQKPTLDEQELRRIAVEEVGMTAQQWEQLQEKYQQYFHRGQSFAEFENWKEAIEEYEQALALRPNQLPLLYELARAYKNLFSDSLDRNDRRRAEFYAKKCLHLAPQFSKASEVLKEVQIIAKRLQQKPKRKGIFTLRNSLLLLVVSGLAILAVIVLIPFGDAEPSEGISVEALEVVQQPQITVSTAMQDLAVRWQDSLNELLEPRQLKAQYRKIGGGMTIKARGWAQVPENRALQGLRVSARLMVNGKAVAQKEFELYSDVQPILRPNDPIPIGINWYFKESPTDKQPQQLQIEVKQVETKRAAWRYPEAQSYPLLGTDSAEQQGLQLRLRRSPYDRFGYHKIAFELQNQTGKPIRELQLRFTYLNSSGEKLASKVQPILTQQTPSLRNGAQLIWGSKQRFRPETSRRRAADLIIQIEQLN